MKKLLSIIFTVAFAGNYLHAQSYPVLDYSQYEYVWGDDFKYADPANPTVVHTFDFKTNPAVVALPGDGSPDIVGNTFSHNWDILMSTGDPLTAWNSLNTFYISDMVTLPSIGVIRLNGSPIGSDRTDPDDGVWIPPTVPDGSGGTKPINYWGGAISSHRMSEFGIIEARMKLSPQSGYYGAFWNNLGEIDIVDVGSPTQIINRKINWIQNYGVSLPTLNPRTTHLPDGTLLPNLSDDFHNYSCIWDPSGVIFFIDGHYTGRIDNSASNSLPSYWYPITVLQFAAEISTGAGSALSYIDIDWVAMYRKKCKNVDLVLNCPYSSACDADAFVYPFIMPGLYKYKTITIDMPVDPTVLPPIPQPLPSSTILEAEATTIKPNFIADESSLITTSGKSTKTDHDTTVKFSGYFLINSINCTYDFGAYKVAHDSSANQGRNGHGDITNRMSGADAISIYPNPVQDNMTIVCPGNSSGQLKILIDDVSGREVYEKTISCGVGDDNKHLVDMKSFIPGVYFVNLTLNEQHVVKKIVKQ